MVDWNSSNIMWITFCFDENWKISSGGETVWANLAPLFHIAGFWMLMKTKYDNWIEIRTTLTNTTTLCNRLWRRDARIKRIIQNAPPTQPRHASLDQSMSVIPKGPWFQTQKDPCTHNRTPTVRIKEASKDMYLLDKAKPIPNNASNNTILGTA